MLTKGIILGKEINSNLYTIRLPLLETAASKDIFTIQAPLCCDDGVINPFNIGEVVYVSFENDEYSKPVIIGRLSLEGLKDKDVQDPNVSYKMNSLEVLNKAILPEDTKIGDISYDNLYEMYQAIEGGSLEGGGSGPSIDSIDGLAGGSLTSPLVIKGGDGLQASKIALDRARAGQITDLSTSTLFGFVSNNDTDVTVGSLNYGINLRGNTPRPKYKGEEIALLSDIGQGESGEEGLVDQIRAKQNPVRYLYPACTISILKASSGRYFKFYVYNNTINMWEDKYEELVNGYYDDITILNNLFNSSLDVSVSYPYPENAYLIFQSSDSTSSAGNNWYALYDINNCPPDNDIIKKGDLFKICGSSSGELPDRIIGTRSNGYPGSGPDNTSYWFPAVKSKPQKFLDISNYIFEYPKQTKTYLFDSEDDLPTTIADFNTKFGTTVPNDGVERRGAFICSTRSTSQYSQVRQFYYSVYGCVFNWQGREVVYNKYTDLNSGYIYGYQTVPVPSYESYPARLFFCRKNSIAVNTADPANRVVDNFYVEDCFYQIQSDNIDFESKYKDYFDSTNVKDALDRLYTHSTVDIAYVYSYIFNNSSVTKQTKTYFFDSESELPKTLSDFNDKFGTSMTSSGTVTYTTAIVCSVSNYTSSSTIYCPYTLYYCSIKTSQTPVVSYKKICDLKNEILYKYAFSGYSGIEYNKLFITNTTIYSCPVSQFNRSKTLDPISLFQEVLIDQAVSPSYSATTSYSVGSYVTRFGKLYRCNTAVSAHTSWDSSKWTEITVMSEMNTKATVTQVAAGTITSISYSTISPYKILVIYGYKTNCPSPNQMSFTLIPDQLNTSGQENFKLPARATTNWEYGLQVKCLNGTVYFYSDTDYSSDTTFTVTKIYGVK